MSAKQQEIGFVGLGVMGQSMAGHLLKAGHAIHAYTRTKSKAQGLLDAGATWEPDLATLAPKCSVIFTMVGYPTDVEEVYVGSRGIIANARPNTLLVDMTTSRPDLAVRIAAAARDKGMQALDAPVSGGDVGAKNATLTIMVGGEPEAFASAKSYFEIMGKTIVRQGGPGAGQHTKMANQIAIAGALAGAIEAVMYARKAGLDPKTVLASIGSGSAGSWQLNTLVPRMLDGNFAPGFYVKHFLKDLRIALESARAMKAELPMLTLAESLYAALSDQGMGELGTHALYRLYEERLGLVPPVTRARPDR